MENQKIQVNEKLISLEDIDTQMLANLNPNERHRNIMVLEEICSRIADDALIAWKMKDSSRAKRYAELCRKTQNALEYYKQERVSAIRTARLYEESKRKETAVPQPAAVGAYY